MSLDFLAHFPYPEARDIQSSVIKILGENWHDYDVFVLSLPTAWGKTALSKTMMGALHSVSVVTPTNQLVNQFQEEFPDTRRLSRLDSYRCEPWARPCSVTRGKLGGFCKGCECSSDLAVAKYRGGPGIYNYHIYLAHKLYRDTLIVDEAHNLVPTIRDRMALKIWQHDYAYPDNMYNSQQIADWIRTLSPTKRRHKKIQTLWESVTHDVPDYQPQRTTDLFNGKGTSRGHPETRDCIKLLPVDISGAPPLFWPRDVEKIVLLSATISHNDVKALGLTSKRVLYIDAESPIPAERRPIVRVPLVSVNRHNIGESADTIARYIEDVIIPHHPGQKGVIHASYQLAAILRSKLIGHQYLFHSRDNKSDVYEQFRAAPAESGRILVASGMYEGVDLPYDLGRWQVIAKIPWQSLESPAVRYQSERDPEWYSWETIRTLIQACGRICRTPTDHGVTVILDSSVDRLLDSYIHLFPEWWIDGLKEGDKLL